MDFFFNDLTNCVDYTGEALGTDTACYVLCDDLGFCDTTFFCIEVEEFFDPPIANYDFDSTETGTPRIIDIKLNDTIFGGDGHDRLSGGPNTSGFDVLWGGPGNDSLMGRGGYHDW